MVWLDTSSLVRGLIAATPEVASVIKWIRKGEVLCASSIAWYEFACGPVDSEGLQLCQSLLAGGLLPFDEMQAAQAARLFNDTGRLRRLRVDAIVSRLLRWSLRKPGHRQPARLSALCRAWSEVALRFECEARSQRARSETGYVNFGIPEAKPAMGRG